PTELQSGGRIGNAPVALAARIAAGVGYETKQLGNGQLAIQRRPLRQIAQLAPRRDRIGARVVAKNFGRPRGWQQKAGEHFHGGGLARAVRAEKTENGSGRHLEAEVVDGDKMTESAGQIPGCKHSSILSWLIIKLQRCPE